MTRDEELAEAAEEAKKQLPVTMAGVTYSEAKAGKCHQCGEHTVVFYDPVEKTWYCNICC